MKENETWYKNEIEHLRDENIILKTGQDNVIHHRNLKKIVELENEIESLKELHVKEIAEIKNERLKREEKSMQTDVINEPLSLIYTHQSYMKNHSCDTLIQVNKTRPPVKKIEKLRRMKIKNNESKNEFVIDKILKKWANKHLSKVNSKTMVSLNNILEIGVNIFHKRIEYLKEKDEYSCPPELKYILYEELLVKYKTPKVALRIYEQVIISLKKLQDSDFRADILKKFLINDEGAFSENILNFFTDISEL